MNTTAIFGSPVRRSADGLPAGGATPTRRILIVEDEKVVADNLAELLTDLGYAIVARVSSGEEAIELSAKTQPDLVLMDIYLHGRMDGVEAAQLINARHNIPIVYLTGHSDRLTQSRIEVTSSFGYVLKPFDEGALRIVIEIALYRVSFEEKLKRFNRELQTSLSKMKRLSGLLFVCAWCKKIQGDAGQWQSLEDYVTSHTSAQFSHGICPVCAARVQAYPSAE